MRLTATFIAIALMLASCSMMQDDRSNCLDCRNPLHVTLRYDYNMQRANMFPDQVQRATVYVVDAATNRVVARQQAANTPGDEPLKQPTYTFNFEGLDAGNYHLLAIAHAPAQAKDTPLQVDELQIGDDISQMRISVPRSDNAGADGHFSVAALPLDTLWHGMLRDVHLEETEPQQATVSLMRLTKNLSIMLMQTENPTDCRADNYDVSITTDNGRMDYLAQPLPDATLTYRPYAAWTTETLTSGESSPLVSTAHYDLSFARLTSHDNASENARLRVVNREDGKTIIDFDLVHYLALARSAAATTYPVQEFLDREHDYRMDIVLSGNEWRYMTLSISVLQWSLRIYNEKL